MKFKIIKKFRSGMTYTTPELDAYQIGGNGDLFKLLIAGKLDSKPIVLDGVEHNFRDLLSFEIVFSE